MEIIQNDKNIIAIIIAIETYRYTDISKVDYALNDANAFKKLLIDHFGASEENITIWLNEHATKTALEEELPYLIRQLSEEDKFIFYYAGHGFHYTDCNRLTVWDSHKNNLFGTTVSINDILLDPLTNSRCENSLLFLDSCATYISEKLDGRDLISSMSLKEFENFGNSTKYNAVFCSCSPGQKSYPSRNIEHGIWTWHLIEALKGNFPEAIFKDTFITDVSLQNFLRKAIPEYITNHTTITATQTPYSQISSSNTFIIRQILPQKQVVEKEFPKIKLQFEKIELRKIEQEHLKQLSGFKKGHFLPDRVSSSGERYIQSISRQEIEDEIQEIYENTKAILGLRRKDIIKEVDHGGGSIETEIFRFYFEIYQNKENPSLADMVRRLIIRVNRFDLPEDFHNIFPVQPNQIIIPIGGTIDYDDLVDKFENLESEIGGHLKDDDSTGEIIYTSKENLTIIINTNFMEMLFIPNKPLDCLKLIDFAADGLSKLTGQKLILLP
ncbi:caspase family protein [Chryseobacterium joostei]|uniref:caspase family protein n=1 Tax=Chryseobacterium joostei TaxID=112234 RepID=UPI003D108A8B